MQEYKSTLNPNLRLRVGAEKKGLIPIKVDRRKVNRETGEVDIVTNERDVTPARLQIILQVYEKV